MNPLLTPNLPKARLGAAKIATLAAGLLLAGFAFLAVAVAGRPITRFDEAVLLALRTPGDPANPLGPPWLEEMGRDVTAIGSLSFLVFVSLVSVGYLLLTKQRGYALRVAVAVAGGEAISATLKSLFDRQRPEISQMARLFTASFPSGHAMLSAVTFVTLGAILAEVTPEPRLKWYFMAIAIFMTLMIGASRLYLGVHYPSDVLAGWCLGLGWALLCWAGSQLLERRK